MSAAYRLLEMINAAGLFDGEHRAMAAAVLCEVSMLEQERDRWKQMHDASVKHRRELLGL